MTPTPRRTIIVPSHRYRRLQFGLGNYPSGGVASQATIFADQAYFANYRRGPLRATGLATGQFNVRCPFSHELADDPIVYPGQPGLAHLHEFFGADTTDAFSTVASMQAGGTSCERAMDKAGYWAPAVYKDGVKQPVATFLAYYRGGNKANLQTIPTGLKMIAGSHTATAPAPVSVVQWACNSSGVTGGGGYNHPPLQSECTQGAAPFRPGFELRIKFPDCWNGTTLDSADHKSHMAYAVGNPTTGRVCPASHPVPIPQIEIKIGYTIFGPGITLSPDPGDVANEPYYTAHSDFFNAWDPDELQRLITTCIVGNRDCGGGG